MLACDSQKIKQKNTILNAITLVIILIIGFALKKQLNDIGQLNQKHSTFLLNLRSKYMNLENDYYNKSSQFGEQDYNIMKSVMAEQKRLAKLAKKLQKYIRMGNQKYNEIIRLKQLTHQQRFSRIQKLINQHQIIINLVQNQIKQAIKQERVKKFDELALKNEYFTSSRKKQIYWLMQRANMKNAFINQQQQKMLQSLYEKQQIRLQETYHISNYTTQIPFCIIVPSYNNVKDFRFQFNLRSILNQKYSNYHVVIVDDASADKTGYFIRRYLQKHNISEEKIKIIINDKRVTAVPNIHYAITKHCKSNEIGFFLDGDDQLLSPMAFQIFNAIYQQKKPAIAYSISLQYWIPDDFVKDGWSRPYSNKEKKNNLYRDVPQKISHLRSFRIDLYLDIKERDLKDQKGEWFTSTYDEVICLPMLEMSCGNIQFINEYLYLYSYGTGYNDRQVDGKLQYSIAEYVKYKMKKYQCNSKYALQNNDNLNQKKGTSLNKLEQQTKSKIPAISK